MPFVTLDQAKLHLRVDMDDEDSLIGLYLKAAESSAVEFLNRNVYADEAAMQEAIENSTAGENPMVATDLIRAAVLLMVGHLYANREEVVAGTNAARMPVGAEYLLQPYRRCLGV